MFLKKRRGDEVVNGVFITLALVSIALFAGGKVYQTLKRASSTGTNTINNAPLLP